MRGGFAPVGAKGETGGRLAGGVANIDHTLNQRKLLISGQLREPEQVRFELKRIVAMGKSRIELEIVDRKEGFAIVFADGRKVEVRSDWKPGDPLWRGTMDSAQSAVHVRPVLRGYALAH